MALAATTNRVQYSGDGSTVVFAVSFVFWDVDDPQAILTDSDGVETIWVRGTQYTLTGGDGDTGTLTVITAPTDYTPQSGETLTIKSNLPNTQPTELPAGGSLPSGVIEQQLDQIVRQIQQVAETIGRTVTLPVSSAISGVTIPDPVAGKLLRWKTDETGLENVDAAASSLTTPISIADGGTGGTTVAAAIANLGVDTAKRLALFHHGGI